MDKFVNSSKDGFIIFSLGSNLLMDDMPEEMLQSFIRTFSKLPQKVIWQWKGKPRSDFPKNILPGYKIGSGLQMTMPDENETKLPKILEILLQKTSILWNATLRTFKYCNFYRKSFQDLGLMQQI